MALDDVTVSTGFLDYTTYIPSGISTTNNGSFGSDPPHTKIQITLASDEFMYVYIVIRLLIGLLICGGNALTIVAVIKFQYLKSNTNYLITSLACADLTASAMPLFFTTLHFTKGMAYWTYLCLIGEIINIITFLSNIFSILWISVDRYIFITRPLRYDMIVTKARTLLLVVLTWLYVLILTSLGVLLGSKLVHGMPCSYVVLLSRDVLIGLEAHFVTITITMTVLYCIIGYVAWGQAKKDRMQNATSASLDSEMCSTSMCVSTINEDNKCSFPQGNLKEAKKQHQHQHMVTKMMSMVLGIYLASYIPSMASAVVLLLYPLPVTFIVHKVSTILWWTNAWLNPFIYAWKHADFRRAFKTLLHIKSNRTNPA